jgi:hypothetical protein
MSFETSALVLAWLVIALMALAMGGMLRHLRQLTMQVGAQPGRLGGPVIGSTFPLPRRAVTNGSDEFFLFLTSPCTSCESLVPEIRAAVSDGLIITTLFRGEAPGYDMGGAVALDHQSSLFDSLQISRTPYIVAVDSEQRVMSSQSVGSPGSLRQLVGSSRRGVSR